MIHCHIIGEIEMARILLLTGVAVASIGGAAAIAPSFAAQGTAPMCRHAPGLPQLPAEAEAQQQQRPPAYERDGSSADVMESLPAPPPPPPPPMVAPPPPSPAPGIDGAVTSASPVSVISSSDIAVTGSRAATGVAKAAPGTVAPPPAAERDSEGAERAYIPSYSPPPGLLTAGDHDDLLNPSLYARYVARAVRQLGQQIAALPRVDTRRVLKIAVEDESGRPVPFVPVRITCADGNHLTLATVADGRVALFPALDRLGEKIIVEANGVRRTIVIDRASGGQEQTLVVGASARPARKFDLMIALDSTGSMGDEIEFLKSELRSILADLQRAYPDLDMRVGLVAYRDLGDDYVTRTDPLTSNFDVVQRSLARTRGEGGGDMPEAMDQALIRAVAQDWRPDAVKSLLLVADAPPHDNLQGRAFIAAEAARARRIQIVPVAASGVDDRAEYFMRAVAAATQSRYIFLTDDSGIGNPHAEPDVDCYVVTQLAGAIRRVLASQISGERLEPYPEEVLRVAGRYDHGKCVLPPNFRIQ
jgi:Mg-chelatase subunit ChlD